MGTISSLNFEDIRTPKLFCENVIGVIYNSSLQATNWGPPKSVSSKEGTLAKFYDPKSTQKGTLNAANSSSNNVVNFESLMQLMYYCILSIRDKKDKEIFESWGKFDMVLGKFTRGIDKLESLLSNAENNEGQINSILENVPEKDGKNKKDKVLKYLNNLKVQIIKWRKEVPESNISTKNPTIQIKIPRLKFTKTKKKPLDTDKSSSGEKSPLMSADSKSDEKVDESCRCTAPGYEKYYYLATIDDDTLRVPDSIDVPQESNEYQFIVSGDCTKDAKSLSFTRKLRNTTPIRDCLEHIANKLFNEYKNNLDIDFKTVKDLATNLLQQRWGDQLHLTHCVEISSYSGIGASTVPIYLACLATDKKTLLPLLIASSTESE